MCLRNWWLTSPWRTVFLKQHPQQGDRAANKLLEMVMVHLGQVQESGNNQSNLWLKLSVMIRYCNNIVLCHQVDLLKRSVSFCTSPSCHWVLPSFASHVSLTFEHSFVEILGIAFGNESGNSAGLYLEEARGSLPTVSDCTQPIRGLPIYPLLLVLHFVGLIPFCMLDMWKGTESVCPSFASNWQHIVKLGATTNCAVVIGPVCIRSNFCEGNENDQGQCIFSTVGDLILKPSHSAE